MCVGRLLTTVSQTLLASSRTVTTPWHVQSASTHVHHSDGSREMRFPPSDPSGLSPKAEDPLPASRHPQKLRPAANVNLNLNVDHVGRSSPQNLIFELKNFRRSLGSSLFSSSATIVKDAVDRRLLYT